MRKSKIALSLATAFGAVAMTTSASAAQIAAGSYSMEIVPTSPCYVVGVICTTVGVDGDWDSSFTLAATPTTAASQPMTDTGPDTVNGVTVGIAGDGMAGSLGITVDAGGNIAFTSVQFDAIYGTAGGTFIKYSDLDSATATTSNGTSLMNGVSTATETTFTLTGLLGGFGAFATMIDNPWGYGIFTTGASTANGVTNNGTAVANVADLNGDGVDDYTATFVMGSNIGAEWGDFNGAPFVEVLKVNIIATVPVPAAVWLFGSGLIGLFAWGKRK